MMNLTEQQQLTLNQISNDENKADPYITLKKVMEAMKGHSFLEVKILLEVAAIQAELMATI